MSIPLNFSSATPSPFIKEGSIATKIPPLNPLYSFEMFDFLTDEKLNLISVGKGAFGELYLAEHKKTSERVAIKQISKKKLLDSGAKPDIIKREIAIHSRLSHPNIVKVYSHFEDDECYYMFMEYVPNGTLFKMIQKSKGLSEANAFEIFIQIASVLHFLHGNNFAHRDIKPENILIMKGNDVKLCDFGWCVNVSTGERATFCGTYEYMAPEIVNDEQYDLSIDIWSLGVLLYEMLHGYSPFKPSSYKNQKNATREIFENIQKHKYKIEKDVSEECRDLIDKLLTMDRSKRIKIDDVFRHPWVLEKEKMYFPDFRREEIIMNNVEEVKNNSKNDEKIFDVNTDKKEKKKSKKKKTKKSEKKGDILLSDIIDQDNKYKSNVIKGNEFNILEDNTKIKDFSLIKEHNKNNNNLEIIHEEESKKPYKNRIKYDNDEDLNVNIDLFKENSDKIDELFSSEKKKSKKNKFKTNISNISKTSNYEFNNPNLSNIINKSELYSKKNKKKEELDLNEDEFNFLKDLNNTRCAFKQNNDPAKVMNMGFLPKDLIYNENNYKDSTINIMKTIDLIEKAQKFREDFNKKKVMEESKNNLIVKKKEEKGFFSKMFSCGCGNNND